MKADNHTKNMFRALAMAECPEAFAVPGAQSLIDMINPHTGKSCCNNETLVEIRQRYPTAQVVKMDDWIDNKARMQDQPVTWELVTEEEFDEMLNCLPPATGGGGRGFLVGEPYDHHAKTGKPRYQAYIRTDSHFVKSSRPMTVMEFQTAINKTVTA